MNDTEERKPLDVLIKLIEGIFTSFTSALSDGGSVGVDSSGAASFNEKNAKEDPFTSFDSSDWRTLESSYAPSAKSGQSQVQGLSSVSAGSCRMSAGSIRSTTSSPFRSSTDGSASEDLALCHRNSPIQRSPSLHVSILKTGSSSPGGTIYDESRRAKERHEIKIAAKRMAETEQNFNKRCGEVLFLKRRFVKEKRFLSSDQISKIGRQVKKRIDDMERIREQIAEQSEGVQILQLQYDRKKHDESKTDFAVWIASKRR